MKGDQIEQVILVGLGLTAACVLAALGQTELAGVVAGGALGYMTPRPKASTGDAS